MILPNPIQINWKGWQTTLNGYINNTTIKEKYDNQYVAIKDRRIIDKDIDHDRLVKRMNITNYDESIAIEYIYNQ